MKKLSYLLTLFCLIISALTVQAEVVNHNYIFKEDFNETHFDFTPWDYAKTGWQKKTPDSTGSGVADHFLTVKADDEVRAVITTPQSEGLIVVSFDFNARNESKALFEVKNKDGFNLLSLTLSDGTLLETYTRKNISEIKDIVWNKCSVTIDFNKKNYSVSLDEQPPIGQFSLQNVSNDLKALHFICIDEVGIGIDNVFIHPLLEENDNMNITDADNTKEILSSLKLIGDQNGQFVSRGEMSIIVSNLLGLQMNNGAPSLRDFSDVNSLRKDFESIAMVANMGIMTGFEDGTFRPDDNITYTQVIKILTDTLGYRFKAVDQGGYER